MPHGNLYSFCYKEIPLIFWSRSKFSDQSIYSLYTWIKGEDAAEEISKFSEEEQYKLGVNAGRYLKEIHSVNAPKSIEDWESRFNRKIDKHPGLLLSLDSANKIIEKEIERNKLINGYYSR